MPARLISPNKVSIISCVHPFSFLGLFILIVLTPFKVETKTSSLAAELENVLLAQRRIDIDFNIFFNDDEQAVKKYQHINSNTCKVYKVIEQEWVKKARTKLKRNLKLHLRGLGI